MHNRYCLLTLVHLIFHKLLDPNTKGPASKPLNDQLKLFIWSEVLTSYSHSNCICTISCSKGSSTTWAGCKEQNPVEFSKERIRCYQLYFQLIPMFKVKHMKWLCRNVTRMTGSQLFISVKATVCVCVCGKVIRKNIAASSSRGPMSRQPQQHLSEMFLLKFCCLWLVQDGSKLCCQTVAQQNQCKSGLTWPS